MQEIKPPVALHVKDQVKFTRVFIREEMAAFKAGGVQQHIDAPAALTDLADDFGHCASIPQVDAEVVRRAAGRLHGLYRG